MPDVQQVLGRAFGILSFSQQLVDGTGRNAAPVNAVNTWLTYYQNWIDLDCRS